MTRRSPWPGFGVRGRDIAVFATAFVLTGMITGSVVLGLLGGVAYAWAIAMPIPRRRADRARQRLLDEANHHAHRADQRIDRIIPRHWPAPDNDRTRRP